MKKLRDRSLCYSGDIRADGKTLAKILWVYAGGNPAAMSQLAKEDSVVCKKDVEECREYIEAHGDDMHTAIDEDFPLFFTDSKRKPTVFESEGNVNLLYECNDIALITLRATNLDSVDEDINIARGLIENMRKERILPFVQIHGKRDSEAFIRALDAMCFEEVALYNLEPTFTGKSVSVYFVPRDIVKDFNNSTAFYSYLEDKYGERKHYCVSSCRDYGWKLDYVDSRS